MTTLGTWESALRELVDGIRTRTRSALVNARSEAARRNLSTAVSQGAGDLTFGLDVPSEDWMDEWLAKQAKSGPLSLMTEDRGWRHVGPEGPLPGFDHGGPRIAVDPIDGTRNLMADLRSAWTVVSFAPPGTDVPRLSDLTIGIVSEIPGRRARLYRTFLGADFGEGPECRVEEHDLDGTEPGERVRVVTDSDDRVDHGYFPFFRYEPRLRPSIARLEAEFFARLERDAGADLRSIFDDQYISNAGQLVQLIDGVYRFIADPRALVARREETETTTSKPYDVGGAILCARLAGACVTQGDGEALDFPMDTETPVDFVGYVNAATRARLEPHWLATLRQQADE